MPNLRNLPPTSPRIPSKPKTSAFHQFGDTVSHTKAGERSDKIFGSINAAIKNKRSPGLAPKDNQPKPRINRSFKPII